MRVVKLTNDRLNKIIKKVIREQQEDQVATTGPKPEEVAGSPEEDNEPNFEGFINAAQELIGQGVTIGDLVDKLIDAQGSEEPESEALPTEPEPDSAIPSDNQ